MKKAAMLVSVLSVLLFIPLNASAYVLLDFEMPREEITGEYPHTVVTPYGNVSFNGRIYNKVGGSIIADHSAPPVVLRTGYFLKNTVANKVITMTFDFDVSAIDAWMVIKDGGVLEQAYDGNGNLLNSSVLHPNASDWMLWENNINITGGDSGYIRKVVFAGDRFNIFAIDDMKIYPIPEPASMILLGVGLFGIIGTKIRGRKK